MVTWEINGGLASIFSDTNKAKFERAFKSTEFIQTPRKRAAEEKATKEPEKTKKPKHKKKAKEEFAEEGKTPTLTGGSGGYDDTDESRTIFIGNIPTSETPESIKSFCKDFGKVLSIRLRSVPT
jgi:RNA recognition motif-containing protein